jgi:hypothetical protein
VLQTGSVDALAEVGQKIDMARIAKIIVEYKTFLIWGSPC